MSSIEQLIRRKSVMENAGGQDRINKQHASGKMTARERLYSFFDDGGFAETGGFRGADIVCGWGRSDGRLVFAWAEDFTVADGGNKAAAYAKVCGAIDEAARVGAPVVAFLDSRGVSVEDGMAVSAALGRVAARMASVRGVIPLAAVVAGPCAGLSACIAQMADFVFMTEGSSELYLNSPDIIDGLSGERISAQLLGGADVSAALAGAADVTAPTDPDCIAALRKLLAYLPSNCRDGAPVFPGDDANRLTPALETLIPEDANAVYPMSEVISACVDSGEYFELKPLFARNIITAFARLGGRAVGLVANNPKVYGGRLDIAACHKAAGFIAFCGSYDIPVITLADVPGFLPAKEQEHAGAAAAAAELLAAYASAACPKVTLVLRCAYDGAGIAMGSLAAGADVAYAMPYAKISAFADGSLDCPFGAAEQGAVDDVIHPSAARRMLIAAVDLLSTKASAPAAVQRRGRYIQL